MLNDVNSQRGAAATLGAVMLALLVGGCGEDAVLDSSNRGSGSHTEATSVENAFIVPKFVPGSCAIQVGDSADLRFTATNNRTTEAEQLSGISTAAAETVRISPAPPVKIPPKSSVAVGQPIQHPGDEAGADEPFTVVMEGLKETARPATSVDVTFQFEKAGAIEVRVPIEACPTQK
jgi:hypothetical protein